MGGTDKTFVDVLGTPLIGHTLRRVAASDAVDRIVLVVAADAVSDGEAIVRDLDIPKIAAVCAGGARRQDSVFAGLLAMGDRRWVAIHDGARPCVTAEILVVLSTKSGSRAPPSRQCRSRTRSKWWATGW